MMRGARRAIFERRGGVRIIILLVVAMLLGGGVSFVVFGRGKSKVTATAAAVAKKPEKPPDPPQFVDMGSFVVNLVSQGDLRYLKVNVSLEILPKPKPGDDKDKDKKKKEPAKEGGGKDAGPKLSPADDARARDTITRVLSDQPFDDLRRGGPREAAKRRLAEELSRVLEEYTVRSVLFTAFVMQ